MPQAPQNLLLQSEVEEIQSIIQNCIKRIEAEGYLSYDIYDALTNPLINFLTSPFTILRRAAIQVNSRSPLDLHWLGMKKMVHTKTVSDLLQYYSIKEKQTTYVNGGIDPDIPQINQLFNKLVELKIADIYAWGLNFPYTSRFVNAGPDTPNLFTTVNSGISICYSLDKLDLANKVTAINVLNGTLEFLDTRMWYADGDGQGWYKYYPGQNYPTYNVNALALYLLVLIQKRTDLAVTGLGEKIISLIELLCKDQQPDGSWTYARSDLGRWIDGFHTGYILESLAFAQSEGFASSRLDLALSGGIHFYIKNLFTGDSYVKYFSNSSKYPMDAQNYAQAIKTLSLLSERGLLEEDPLLKGIIENSITHLYNTKGSFNHKKTKYFTFSTPYFRWSVTPMILALEYANQYFIKKMINL